ncbi:MAG: two-component regulator propeller domain-containing protein [Ignavibacteria bacterium]|nr:two-component regulator propeller domain-containing protein [Ignavibacteria bacterium]
MKKITLAGLIFTQLLILSCSDAIDSPLSNIHLSEHVLNNYFVTALAFDSQGTAWLGTFNQGLIKYDGSISVYNKANSTLPDSMVIWDIEIDKSDNVWIGSDKGLIKYDRSRFFLFNKKNAPMVTDNVFTLSVTNDNIIWFSSCMFREGGIMNYDGVKWNTFTPQNSLLPGSLINDIAIDKQNNAWVTVNEGVTSCSIVRITGNQIQVFGEKEIGFKPYYFGHIVIGFESRIYANIDYTLSSSMNITRPNIITYDGKSWKEIKPVDSNGNSLGLVDEIAVDLSGNLWASTSKKGLVAYDGNQWFYDAKMFSIHSGIFDIAVDRSNNVWVASGEGVYIIKHNSL